MVKEKIIEALEEMFDMKNDGITIALPAEQVQDAKDRDCLGFTISQIERTDQLLHVVRGGTQKEREPELIARKRKLISEVWARLRQARDRTRQREYSAEAIRHYHELCRLWINAGGSVLLIQQNEKEEGFMPWEERARIIEEDNRARQRRKEEEDVRKREADRRRREEQITKKGRLVYGIESLARGVDHAFGFVCDAIVPLLIVYLPIRFLAIGIWKLLGWLAGAAGAEATRAVKAARTKARDFEKATRPE